MPVSAYFSYNMFLNHAAINVVWNSGTAFFAEEIDYSRYKYFDKKKSMNYLQLSMSHPICCYSFRQSTKENCCCCF
jgi:hypothetical protein